MTTFAELEALVIAQTRRPEIPGITKAAVKSAVLRAHHTDFFPRDLRSQQIPYVALPSALYYEVPNISTVALRVRSIKFFQSLDSMSFVPVEKLDYHESDDVYDLDGNLRESIYTLIGDTVRLYPICVPQLFEMWYYQNPDTSEVSMTSWIADLYPDEIAMWAAGIVWARTGFAEMARDVQETHVKPLKEMLSASHLLGTVN